MGKAKTEPTQTGPIEVARPSADQEVIKPDTSVVAEMNKLQEKYDRLKDSGSDRAEGAWDDLMAFKIENGLVEEASLGDDDEDINIDEVEEDDTTDNAFCPTGEGGGIDPSCSPGGSRTGTGRSVQSSIASLKSVKDDLTKGVADMREAMSSLDKMSKSEINEISKAFGYTPGETKVKTLHRLKSNLEDIKLHQLRAGLIEGGLS